MTVIPVIPKSIIRQTANDCTGYLLNSPGDTLFTERVLHNRIREDSILNYSEEKDLGMQASVFIRDLVDYTLEKIMSNSDSARVATPFTNKSINTRIKILQCSCSLHL